MTSVRRLILDDSAAVARAAADLLAEEVAAQREIVLALPTGRTPIPFYDELAARHAAGRLDLTRARGFNLDEIVLPRHDPRTFRSFMEQHAWGRTGLRRDRCDIPDGAAPDLEAECAALRARDHGRGRDRRRDPRRRRGRPHRVQHAGPDAAGRRT